MDLFTSWQHRDEFAELAAAVVAALESAGCKVSVIICALFGRALPRDFLDVDAAIISGRYTRERLLELAAEAGSGSVPVVDRRAAGRGACSARSRAQ